MKRARANSKAGAEAVTVTTMATRVEMRVARILRILLVAVMAIVVITPERVKVLTVVTRRRRRQGVSNARALSRSEALHRKRLHQDLRPVEAGFTCLTWA